MRSVILFMTLIGVCGAAAQIPDAVSYEDTTAMTRRVATRYCTLYLSKEVDSLALLMHPGITFEDPTARYVFTGGRHMGREAVLQAFRRSLGHITGLSATLVRSIISANTALFETTLRWSFKSRAGRSINITTPLVIVLTVSGGTVIEHRDYGDYTTFREQYDRQNE